jgi:lipopolysaccharide export system ATP-binding protein
LLEAVERIWSMGVELLRSDGHAAARPATAPAELEVSAQGLVRRYGRRTVVNGVNLEFCSDMIVGLLGPNGAGKTTILHMVIGLVPPTSGRVLLNGSDITEVPMYQRARAGIAYLPQESSIFRKMTVEQNLLAVLESAGLPSAERGPRMIEAMRSLSILHLAHAPAFALSGGERRRAEIARALVLSPKLLILDEPFAGINPIAVADIQQIILRLKKSGIGTLISDHNARETLRITDDAYIVADGKIFMHGRSCDLALSPKVRRLYLGEDFVLDELPGAASDR